MVTQPFYFYSYQMDSDEVKNYMVECPDTFETKVLRYLLNPDISECIMLDGKNVLMKCSITGSSLLGLTREEAFAILTENIGLIYSPFCMDDCRVFLKPNLHHFADAFIISKQSVKNEVSKITHKSASTVGRAVVGGAIAGPTGAVVGAASAIDKNNRGGKTKVERREVGLYSILLAGAVEFEDQEQWSEIDTIIFNKLYISF